MAKNLEVSFLLDFYGEMLTQKQHDFLVYYYDAHGLRHHFGELAP